jgi:hypothetical protein
MVEESGYRSPLEVAQVGCILHSTVWSLPLTSGATMIPHILIAIVAGWLQRHI